MLARPAQTGSSYRRRCTLSGEQHQQQQQEQAQRERAPLLGAPCSAQQTGLFPGRESTNALRTVGCVYAATGGWTTAASCARPARAASSRREVHFATLVLLVELYTPDTDGALCTLFTKPKAREATVEAQVECFCGGGALGMKDPKLLQAFGRREFGEVMLVGH